MIRCLAFDLGASSGRLILGSLDNRKLQVEEIYRFPNEIMNINGHSHWNIVRLFEEMKKGLEIFARSGLKAHSVGIDTWGVDFVLLGCNDSLSGLPFAYRDCRYDGVMDDFDRNVMPLSELYELSGLQMMQFNSIFQLYSQKRDKVPAIETATSLLYIADYFNFLLTGVKKNEFTFASTSQLINPLTRQYNPYLFKAIGVDISIVNEIVMPATIIGKLSESICTETSMDALPLIAVASHDTASAIAAVPAEGENWAYLSSGTWSLMGIELHEALITSKTAEYNFTNEGGVNGTYRFLKNIGGLWLLEQCKRSWKLQGYEYTYDELVKMAEEEEPFIRFVDPDAIHLLNPPDMPKAITEFCIATGQSVPQSHGQMVRLIYESLAMKYRYIFRMLCEISPKPLETLHIIGGGSKNEFLCQLTADALGVPVVAGPTEATAVGNLLVQAMALGEIKSLDSLREVVKNSFELHRFEVENAEIWDSAYLNFLEVTKLK